MLPVKYHGHKLLRRRHVARIQDHLHVLLHFDFHIDGGPNFFRKCIDNALSRHFPDKLMIRKSPKKNKKI